MILEYFRNEEFVFAMPVFIDFFATSPLETNPSDALWKALPRFLQPKAVIFFHFFLEYDGEVFVLPKYSLILRKPRQKKTKLAKTH